MHNNRSQVMRQLDLTAIAVRAALHRVEQLERANEAATERIAELESALSRVKNDLIDINLFSDTEEERIIAKDLLDRLGTAVKGK